MNNQKPFNDDFYRGYQPKNNESSLNESPNWGEYTNAQEIISQITKDIELIQPREIPDYILTTHRLKAALERHAQRQTAISGEDSMPSVSLIPEWMRNMSSFVAVKTIAYADLKELARTALEMIGKGKKIMVMVEPEQEQELAQWQLFWQSKVGDQRSSTKFQPSLVLDLANSFFHANGDGLLEPEQRLQAQAMLAHYLELGWEVTGLLYLAEPIAQKLTPGEDILGYVQNFQGEFLNQIPELSTVYLLRANSPYIAIIHDDDYLAFNGVNRYSYHNPEDNPDLGLPPFDLETRDFRPPGIGVFDYHEATNKNPACLFITASDILRELTIKAQIPTIPIWKWLAEPAHANWH